VAEPNADRVVLLPTAYTHPAGTVYLSSYEIVVLQAGYALTDRTQITLTATPPLEGGLVPLDLSLKTAVYRGPLVRAAGLFSASGIGGLIGSGLALVGRVGGVVQLCPDPACRSSLVAGTNLTLVGAVIMASSLGAIVRLGRRVALLAEADTITPLGTAAGEVNGVALSLGVRLFWRRFAADLAVAHGFNAETGGTLPLLVLTYRTVR
jgi:hypothetical protein